jgi:hypothetical protein
MLKNVFVFICVLILTSSFSLAASPTPSRDNGISNAPATTDQPSMSAKEEKAQYKSSIKALVKKYNSASAAQKESVRAEVKTLVSQHVEKEIERKKARIAALEEEIKEFTSNKNAYIEKKVDKELKIKKSKK